MKQWQCPICKSHRVILVVDTIICLCCGNQDYLYDYANAYDANNN